MKNSIKYLINFFEELQIFEDNKNNSNYKQNIYKVIKTFIEDANFNTAFGVYKEFFNLYWIGIQEEKNPFVELQNKMREYEQNSGRLLKKQRDHYMHSVYVFILGICLFQISGNYKKIFETVILNKSEYPDAYKTKNEEFFYRWGIASLFHDIAYPIQITIEQAKEYLEFLTGYPEDKLIEKINVKMIFEGIENFKKMPQLIPKDEFEEEFIQKYPIYSSKMLDNFVDILADNLSNHFNIDFDKIKNEFYNYESFMQKESIIDHGYYSALIVMRWYYYLIQKTKWNPAYFYYPIVDVASAILLHNYYERDLMKEPFNLKKLKIKDHPIAYLLILCDELQEWNRTVYGKDSVNTWHIKDYDLFYENSLSLVYIVERGGENNDITNKKIDNYINDKNDKISRTINIYDLSDNGLQIKMEVL